MSRISKDLKSVPKPTGKDIALALVSFPLMLLAAAVLGLWGIVRALRERISILVRGDRSQEGK